MLILVAWLIGCGGHTPHDHAEDHPDGHDHHDEDHGHADAAVARITRWGERLELFAEHAPSIVGQETALLVHLTVLDSFRPLERGELRLELDGPTNVRAGTSTPVRPGIFSIAFVPPAPGRYSGRLIVSGDVEDAIEDVGVEVFESLDRAVSTSGSEDDAGLIELLKEQQWRVPFATDFARQGSLSEAVEVAGELGTPPGGSAEVGPPVAGRLVPPARGFPRPGEVVRKGQTLALLAPAPSTPEETSRARLAIAEAEARVGRARTELDRAERLFREELIARRDLEDAQRELAVAEASLVSAHQEQQLYHGASQGIGEGAWSITTPISGTVSEVHASPGRSVTPGELLFRIIDPAEIWVRARVPEGDAPRIRAERDASFLPAGLDRFLPLTLSGPHRNAVLVAIDRAVDPRSRTVEVIYALKRPDQQLRVGGLVRVVVPTGDQVAGLVVPRSAIVSDEGQDVVYVQVDGEHFEERIVRVGARHGQSALILDGVRENERVVVRGATVVRLASNTEAAAGHGHLH